MERGSSSTQTVERLRRATTPPDSVRIVAHEPVFQGDLLSAYVDTIECAPGKRQTREIVVHPGAAAVVPVLPDGDVLLVRQYRHAVRSYLWEIPAGKLEPQEDPLTCAQRELAEETGYAADRWRHVFTFFSSPGFSSERIALYHAAGLRAVERPTADDIAELRALPIGTIERMIRSSEIVDAKTILAIAWLGGRALDGG